MCETELPSADIKPSLGDTIAEMHRAIMALRLEVPDAIADGVAARFSKVLEVLAENRWHPVSQTEQPKEDSNPCEDGRGCYHGKVFIESDLSMAPCPTCTKSAEQAESQTLATLAEVRRVIADYEINGSFAEGLTIDRIKALINA